MKNANTMKRILQTEGLTSVYLEDSSNRLSRLVLWTSKIIAGQRDCIGVHVRLKQYTQYNILIC